VPPAAAQLFSCRYVPGAEHIVRAVGSQRLAILGEASAVDAAAVAETNRSQTGDYAGGQRITVAVGSLGLVLRWETGRRWIAREAKTEGH
jgi:hypothetical protein